MRTNAKIIVMFLSFLAYNLRSQDIHFSQSFHAPNLLNPAETGNFFGDWRGVHNYRQQWTQIGKPLTTAAFGIERQFYLSRQKLSVGVSVVHDESGLFRITHQKLMGALAYHHTWRKNQFHIGAQAGYVYKQLGASGMSFPDQFDQSTGVFNADLETRERLLFEAETYADVNLGFAYTRQIGRFEPTFGFALYHINQPNESFLNDVNFLAVREVFYSKMRVSINDRYDIEPQVLYMSQRKARDLLAGAIGYMRLSDNVIRAQNVLGGFYVRDGVTRNWDALIALIGLEFNQWRTALSYDFTVSKLRLANSYRGAVEFSIIFTGISSVLQKRTLPCNRM